MRKGIHGLAMLIEENIEKKCGKEGLFVFRSKRGDRIKMVWWDGQGFCLYYKCMQGCSEKKKIAFTLAYKENKG